MHRYVLNTNVYLYWGHTLPSNIKHLGGGGTEVSVYTGGEVTINISE